MKRVGCENLVTPPGRPRERHRRVDHDAEHERHRMPTPLQPAASAPGAWATARDVAGARGNDRWRPCRTRSKCCWLRISSQSKHSERRSARIAQRPRWLVARETVSERPQCPRFGTHRQTDRWISDPDHKLETVSVPCALPRSATAAEPAEWSTVRSDSVTLRGSPGRLPWTGGSAVVRVQPEETDDAAGAASDSWPSKLQIQLVARSRNHIFNSPLTNGW